MKLNKLKDMVRGWFIGAFHGSIYHTDICELAIKKYSKNDFEKKHHHKIATEITAIISGKVKMNNVEYEAGDIITIEPNESTDFIVLEDTVTCVIKIPGALNDKYTDDN